jgi:hypothetical protein
VETSPHGRRVDAEHVARLLRSETKPIDQDQRFPLSSRELGDRAPNVMARGQRPAEIFRRDGGEDPASPNDEPAKAIPIQVQRRSIHVPGG